MEESIINSALNLNRKLPPHKIPQNVAALSTIVTDEDKQDEMIQRIDQPLETIRDTVSAADFLK